MRIILISRVRYAVHERKFNVMGSMLSREKCHTWEMRQGHVIAAFCPGFQKGRVPSEKGTLAR